MFETFRSSQFDRSCNLPARLAELVCVLPEQINMVAVSKKAFLLFITLLNKQGNFKPQLTYFLFLFFSGSSMASVILKNAAEKLVGLRK